MSVPESPPGGKDQRPMLVVLTGGIASGKSAVSHRFAELGAPVIDTDVIAREVVAPGEPGLKQLVDAFGKGMLDDNGSLDRKRLGERVFADESARRRLENILHPLIVERARAQVAARSADPYVILVVPLLVESGLFEDADCVIVVDVPETVQIERLMKRDGIDETRARAMLEAQAGRRERLAVADEVIDNSGSPEDLRNAVDRLHRNLLARAEG